MLINDSRFMQIQMLLGHERFQEALGVCQQMLMDDPESSTVFQLRALALAGLKQFDAATESAERAISLSPDDAFAHYVMADIWNRRNYPDKSMQAIDESLRLQQDEPEFYFFKGHLLADKKLWNQALSYFDEALALNPEHGSSLALRSMVLTQLGNKSEAQSTAEAALRKNPDNPINHANEGFRLLSNGQYQKSKEHFREALRLDPNNEFARAGALEALRASNPFYRVVLWYFLQMNKLQGRWQTMIILGLFFLQQWIVNANFDNPIIAMGATGFLITYFIFALSCWFMQPLSDSFLRFSSLGNVLLNESQKWRSTIFLLLFVAGLVAFCVSYQDVKYEMIFISCLALSFPVMLIFEMKARWTQLVMGLMMATIMLTTLTICTIFFWKVSADGTFNQNDIGWLRLAYSIRDLLFYMTIGSQLSGIYLMNIRERY